MPAEFDLIDFVTMVPQAEKFGPHVSRVPYCDTLVSTARDHQVLVERRVVDTHYSGYVRINGFHRLALPHIPNLELPIIAY